MNTSINLLGIASLCLSIGVLYLLRNYTVLNHKIKKRQEEISHLDNCATLQAEQIKKADNSDTVAELKRDIFYLSNPLKYKYDDIIYFHRHTACDTSIIQGRYKGRRYAEAKCTADEFTEYIKYNAMYTLEQQRRATQPSFIYTIDTGESIIEVRHDLIIEDIEEDITHVTKDGSYGAIQMQIMPENKGECLNAELNNKIMTYNNELENDSKRTN